MKRQKKIGTVRSWCPIFSRGETNYFCVFLETDTLESDSLRLSIGHIENYSFSFANFPAHCCAYFYLNCVDLQMQNLWIRKAEYVWNFTSISLLHCHNATRSVQLEVRNEWKRETEIQGRNKFIVEFEKYDACPFQKACCTE